MRITVTVVLWSLLATAALAQHRGAGHGGFSGRSFSGGGHVASRGFAGGGSYARGYGGRAFVGSRGYGGFVGGNRSHGYGYYRGRGGYGFGSYRRYGYGRGFAFSFGYAPWYYWPGYDYYDPYVWYPYPYPSAYAYPEPAPYYPDGNTGYSYDRYVDPRAASSRVPPAYDGRSAYAADGQWHHFGDSVRTFAETAAGILKRR
jgi:hypothetical protein